MKTIRILGVLAVVSLAAACTKTAAAGPGSTSTSSTPTTSAVTPTTSPPTTQAPTTTTLAPTTTTVPTRQVKGTAVTLGAGSFTGGKDVADGLYNVTPGAGQSGDFIVTGTDSYYDILGGSSAEGGVPNVTVSLTDGDVIQISGMSQVTMTAI
jgi:hypothetical protein